MAEVIIPPGYGQMTATWTNVGLSAPVTVTCGYTNTPSASPVDEVAEAIFLMWAADGGPADADFMLVGWTFESVYCLQHTQSGMMVSATYAAPINGTQVLSGGAQPPYSPLVVSKTTAQAGKRFRGRMYPPMTYGTEGSVGINGNIDTVAALPQLRALYSALYSDWSASPFAPRLLHSEVGVEPTPISSFLVRPVVGTQRRRKAR